MYEPYDTVNIGIAFVLSLFYLYEISTNTNFVFSVELLAFLVIVFMICVAISETIRLFKMRGSIKHK